MFRKFDFKKIAQIQTRQTFNAIYVEGTVPKLADGGTAIATINISNRGAFLSELVTGSYSTLVDDPNNQGNPADDGVNHLKVKITSQSSGNNLFESFIPLNLFLTPGRQRTPGVYVDAATGVPNASGPLFYPMRLEYLWIPNDVVTLEFKNDANWANSFKIAFWGARGVDGIEHFTNQGQ